MFSAVLKANPYHDKEGKFTSKDKAGGWTAYESPSKNPVLTDSAKRMKSHLKDMDDLRAKGVDLIRTANPEDDPDGVERMSLQEAAEQFDRFTGGAVTVKEYMGAMLGKGWEDNDGKKQLDFTLDENGSPVMRLRQVGGTLHGAQMAWFEHSISRDTLDAHLDYFKVKDTERGGGAAKTFFRETTPMMRKIGMDTLSLQANLDAGGYCWARFGFQSVNRTQVWEQAYDHQVKLGELVKDKGGSAMLPKDAQEELSAMRWLHDYVKEERPIDGMRLLSDAKTPALDRVFQTEINEALKHTKNPTLVKALMKESNWYATLNLKDKELTDRLGTYVGAKV